MAYPVDAKVTTTDGVADTDLEADNPVFQAGDWLLAVLVSQNVTVTTPPSGWTEAYNQQAGSNTRAAIYKKLAVANEPNPAFVISSAATMAVIVMSFRDGDPTDIIEAIQGTVDAGSVTTHPAPAITSVTNNALILEISAFSSTGIRINTAPTPLRQYIGHTQTDRTIIVRAIGQLTAGTLSASDIYTPSGQRGITVRIALKNASGGRKAIVATGGPSGIKLCGTGDPITTVTNISTIRTTFGGVATEAFTSLSVNDTSGTGVNLPWAFGSRVTFAPPSTGVKWYGFYFTVSAANFSGLTCLGITDSLNSNQTEFGTISLYLEDSVGAWGLYKIGHRTPSNGAMYFHVADLTVLDSSGTIDLTDVIRIGHCWKRKGTAIGSKSVDLCGLAGNAANIFTGYVTPRLISKCLAGRGINNRSFSQGELQDALAFDIQIGDGTNATEYSARATSTEMPFGVTAYVDKDSDKTIRVLASASDVIDFSQSIISGTKLFNFIIDPSSSTSASYSGNGAILRGATPTWKTGIVANGRTFLLCGPIDAKGAVFNNCNILRTLASSSQAAIKFDANSSMSGTEIDLTNTVAGYHIELGTAVTAFTLTDVTFTGTPGTNKIHVLRTTGTVTITATGTTLSEGEITSAGATVVLVLDVVTVKVTIRDVRTLAPVSSAAVLLTADSGGALPYQESVTITRSGSTATVAHTAHGMSNGEKVRIYGANQDEYNGVFALTYIDANSYSYTVTGTPATPATGSVTATAVLLEGTTDGSGIIQRTDWQFAGNQPVIGRSRKGSSPRYASGVVSGLINSGGLDATAFLTPTE